MARSPSAPWPTDPRTVFFDDVATPPTRTRATKEGRIRRIATGVWTADMVSPVEEIVRANALAIIARRIGAVVLVDRTAAMAGKVDNGVVAVATDERASDLKLPGVTVRVRPMTRHKSDIEFLHPGMCLAMPARALVDNLSGPANADRILTTAELQDWLARKKLDYGDERFGRLREDAHAVAADFGTDVHDRIEDLFAIANQEAGAQSPVGQFAAAAVAGDLYDDQRLVLFSAMRDQLASVQGWSHLPQPEVDGELPFFESYFSNYIEGTEFDVEEARRIVELNQMPDDRPEDAHDVLYTYHCVASRVGRASTSTDPSKVREILAERHHTFMAGRPKMTPGVFKTKMNRVGSLQFVKPHHVEGTLRRALRDMPDLPAGLARAVYVMVVVAEIHPFLDGNGRAARLMMNAELSEQNLCRIVVPTVCRNEYIASLQRFSRGGGVDAIVKVLENCWRWTHSVPWASREATDAYLDSTNAFMDSNEAAMNRMRLLIH